MKTVIPDLTKMIEASMQAIASYHKRPGLLECEDYIYSEMEESVRIEILCELHKAKKLMRTQKGWRWKIIKQTKGNPVKVLFLIMAWWKNFKFKKLWQRT